MELEKYMSLKHRFFLLTENEFKYADYEYGCDFKIEESLGLRASVELDDEFLRYIWDMLSLIPCIKLGSDRLILGLELYSITVINHEGAEMLYHIATSWAKLLEKSPSQLELKGLWKQPV